MPWADPDKNREAVERWRERHPGWRSRYAPSKRPATPLPLSQYQALEEDLVQQRALYRLSRQKSDDPKEYEHRERQWIHATAFWALDGSGQDRRRSDRPDKA